MLLASFPAGPWQTNCYVVSPEPGAPCVVIDPGYQAAASVRRVVQANGLSPAAVLLTHGHLDHTFSAAEICAEYDVPCHIHLDDRPLLTEPMRAMPPGSEQLLAQLPDAPGGLAETGRLVEPAQVRELGGEWLEAAGLRFGVRHAPGHTPGSVVFLLDYPEDERIREVVFSGDVLFAGSIGRTDLPGSDERAMRISLREQILTLDDTDVVLPGHGPQTTVARERAGNPYLQTAHLENAQTEKHRDNTSEDPS